MKPVNSLNLFSIVMYNLWHYLSTLCDKVCEWLAFSPGTRVSSTNKTDRHDITEILLKVALNTINKPNIHYLQLVGGVEYLVEVKVQFGILNISIIGRLKYIPERGHRLFVCCYCDAKIIVFILFWFHAGKCHQINVFQPP
jgi:hypothetical protein